VRDGGLDVRRLGIFAVVAARFGAQAQQLSRGRQARVARESSATRCRCASAPGASMAIAASKSSDGTRL
jgi:hypothetical protein